MTIMMTGGQTPGQTAPHPDDPVDVWPYLDEIELLTTKLKQTIKRSKNRHKAIKELHKHIDKLTAENKRLHDTFLKEAGKILDLNTKLKREAIDSRREVEELRVGYEKQLNTSNELREKLKDKYKQISFLRETRGIR